MTEARFDSIESSCTVVVRCTDTNDYHKIPEGQIVIESKRHDNQGSRPASFTKEEARAIAHLILGVAGGAT